MSSNSFRDPLCGIIVQGDRVVGSICIPKDDGGEFIEEFNNCYGPLRMQAAEIPDQDVGPPVPIATGVCLLPTWFSQAWRPPNLG